LATEVNEQLEQENIMAKQRNKHGASFKRAKKKKEAQKKK